MDSQPPLEGTFSNINPPPATNDASSAATNLNAGGSNGGCCIGRVVTRNLVHKLNAAAAAAQNLPDVDGGNDPLSTNGMQGGADQNYQFYKEYCRLYYANIILTNRLQQLLNEKQELQFKLNRLEVRDK
jgi:hypothetical protein